MRRSAIREEIKALVEAVVPGDDKRYAGTKTLQHTRALQLVDASERTSHLVYVVDMAETAPIDRGRAGQNSMTSCTIQVVFALRAGSSGEGQWADVDACSDLAEDIVAAVDAGGADWESVFERFSVEELAKTDGGSLAVLADISFTIHHRLGG